MTTKQEPSAVEILGVSIAAVDQPTAMRSIDDAIEAKVPMRLAFANANLLNHAAADPRVRQALGGFTVYNDGIGVDIARRVLAGAPFPANMNGTDFTPYILEHSRHSLRVFILGSRPDTIEKAARAVERDYPRHEVVGYQHGYASEEEHGAIADRIASLDVDILMVGMGNPIQELWLDRHHRRSRATIGMGIGAQIDRFAGEVERPPQLVLDMRIEWLYRLAREPRRLAKRYVLGNATFLARIARQRLTGR